MDDWKPIPKPAELAESRLISAILKGIFPINSDLPAERDLASRLGVTRPTLREALQRLSSDGWIEIHHGRSTRVKDYWREGNLSILGTIARHQEAVPPEFVANLLQLREVLAPTYTRQAVERNGDAVLALLESMQSLEDIPEDFAIADWRLLRELTILSENPIFTLIVNGFSDLYQTMAVRYFRFSTLRDHSRKYYSDLLDAVGRQDAQAAGEITHQVMAESLQKWILAENGRSL